MSLLRSFLFALAMACFSAAPALAQGCGPTNPNCVVPTAPAGTSNNQAASTAFVTGSASSAARTRLLANTTFNVATTGADSNNCVAATPCLTIQRAYDNLANFYDLAGFTATIQVANGTYSAGLITSKSVPGGNGPGSVIIQGSATPSNVLVAVTSTDAFGIGETVAGSGSSSSGTQLTIAGIKITVATSGNAISVNGGGSGVVVGAPGFPVEFGSTFQDHMIASHGAWLIAGTNNLVSGGALIHVAAVSGGIAALHNTTEIYSNSPAFTYWGYAETNGNLYVDSMTFTNGNTVTGTRYFANLAGVIYACPVISGTCSPASTYLPGNSSGVQLNSGFYLAGPSTPWPVVQGGSGADLSATGGAGQYVKQVSTGAAFTVGTIPSGDLVYAAPTTQSGSSYTVGATDYSIIGNNSGGTLTLTLPAAASFSGRILLIKTTQAQTVVSASSNVVPLAGGVAGTAILAATAGKWAMLQSDATNWIIMAGN